MEKDFDIWNNQKKLIEQRSHRVIHEGEILWCSLGLNIGHEQDGKNQIFERPVLVIRKFSNEIVWCIPISSKLKSGPYYQNFSFEGQEYCCILSQLRLISTKRFSRYIRKVGTGTFFNVVEKTLELFPRGNINKVKQNPSVRGISRLT